MEGEPTSIYRAQKTEERRDTRFTKTVAREVARIGTNGGQFRRFGVGMQLNTLIIGYVPITDLTTARGRAVKADQYFKELVSGFDLGTVHYASREDWKVKVDETSPIVIISLGGDWYAQEVKEYKKDAALYAAEHPNGVFNRKAEVEEKKAKNIKIFTEIAGILKQIRDEGEEQLKVVRKFSAMSYKDVYDMLVQMIISDNEEAKQKAWELLTSNDVHSNFIWMRAQMMMEAWQHADGKGKEQFLCMSMDQHIENGMARKMDDFTDEDGQRYHQYMFCDLFGCDLNYIRRIPFGTKGQDKYNYQAILDKYETPNGLQMNLEAGQMKSKKKEYFKTESEKVLRVLTAWKENHELSKKELGVVPWEEGDSTDDSLTERELRSMKNFLEEHDKTGFDALLGP